MPSGSNSRCTSTSHQLLVNRLNDLQERFTNLQAARAEGRINDMVVLEEQVHQSLREWKAELITPSPSSSSLAGSLGFFSDEIGRLLQLHEEDDATSALPEPAVLKTEADSQHDVNNPHLSSLTEFQEDYLVSDDNQEHGFQGFDQCKGSASGVDNAVVNHVDLANHLDYHQLNLYGAFNHRISLDNNDTKECGKDGLDDAVVNHLHLGNHLDHHQLNLYGGSNCGLSPVVNETEECGKDGLDNALVNHVDLGNHLDHHQLNLYEGFNQGLCANGTKECAKDIESSIMPFICPPSAFMGPKCALWDCTRPAVGSEWHQDYCCSFHATLSLNEGCSGMTPVLRPGGIVLKDKLLFDALNAKAQGKNVGIPQCEGAATTKSPWNATELFDLLLLRDETIREWLFFDKPRRAFDSGNRKQRSLPDYRGRGWHESRKQVMKEFGGQKRSYYMDPQPLPGLEWHLYEYESTGCDACALYRLELKLASEKRSPKGKITKDSLTDLQKKMGRLTAEVPTDYRESVKGSTILKPDAVNINIAQDHMNSSTGA